MRKLPQNEAEFRGEYWLKKDLLQLCRLHGLPIAGNKADLTEYLSAHLEGRIVGKKSLSGIQPVNGTGHGIKLSPEIKIQSPYSSNEIHRLFFESLIGDHFKFNVPFMKWMKENEGSKKYSEAISEWQRIHAEAKQGKKIPIAKQFEYNQYTRDFFQANPNANRKDCLRCWTFKKGVAGNHRYQKSDLEILKTESKGEGRNP